MKLSGPQFVWIIVTSEIIAIIGLRITPAIQMVKQDAWISMLVGGILGVALTFLFVHLSQLHPNQTLVQFSRSLLGIWLGRMIALPYLIAWYILPAILLRSFSDFIHLILLDRTPVWIIMLLLIGLMTYLNYTAGIMGIGRFSELVGPLIVLTLLVSFILNVQNIEWHHILPIYSDSGLVNILKASLPIAIWFPGPFILLVIVAFMQNPQKALSQSILGVGITVLFSLTATLMVLWVFGPDLSAKIRFSYVTSVKTINILHFIQNVDIFIMFTWIFGVTSQLSLYLFIASYELANWFNMKEWRSTIWFSVPTIYILAFLIPDQAAIASFIKFWTSIIFPVLGIGIPLFLWFISVVKKKSLKAERSG